MTKLLVVRAHPLTGRKSRSMQVTDAFLTSYRLSNPTHVIEDINVYNQYIPEIDKDLLEAWSILQNGGRFYTLSEQQQRKVTVFDSFTDSFLDHDKIVITNPLWNLSIPTKLKAWFDAITVAGKTFQYTDHGSVGMIEGKKALHIQANGGVYGGKDPASQYVKMMLNFLGIEDCEQLFVEGMNHHPEQAEEIVEKAMKH